MSVTTFKWFWKKNSWMWIEGTHQYSFMLFFQHFHICEIFHHKKLGEKFLIFFQYRFLLHFAYKPKIFFGIVFNWWVFRNAPTVWINRSSQFCLESSPKLFTLPCKYTTHLYQPALTAVTHSVTDAASFCFLEWLLCSGCNTSC